jgi:hypothetical protein
MVQGHVGLLREFAQLIRRPGPITGVIRILGFFSSQLSLPTPTLHLHISSILVSNFRFTPALLNQGLEEGPVRAGARRGAASLRDGKVQGQARGMLPSPQMWRESLGWCNECNPWRRFDKRGGILQGRAFSLLLSPNLPSADRVYSRRTRRA